MVTELSIYWITRLDSICILVQNVACIFTVFFVLSIIAICVMSIIMLCNKFDVVSVYGADHIDEDKDYCMMRSVHRAMAKMTGAFAALALAANVGAAFIPTTKEYCAIKVVPAILNNEKAAPLADELYSLGIEWLKELRPQAASSEQPATNSH